MPKVLLVDLSSIAHPIWHMSQAEPDPDHTSQRTAAAVRSIAAEYPHTAICCDSKSSFRKELDATYKANRPPSEAPLHHQIDLAREALEADGFPVWCVEGFEGDDLIASAAKKLTEKTWALNPDSPQDSKLADFGHGNSVLIASADKDLLALVTEHVEVLNTRNLMTIGRTEVNEKLGIDPCQMTDYLTLVGDASDNIQGARGIGPKTAKEWLNTYGNLEDVYRALDDGNADAGMVKPAQRESLKELRPRLDTVRALVRMRTDVPLAVAAVFQPRVPKVADQFLEDQFLEEDDPAALLPPPPDIPPRTPAPPAPPAPPAAAVAIVEQPAPAEWERSLEPRSMDDACVLAKRLHESRMFSAYGSPQAVLSTLMLGRELGLPAMAVAPKCPHHRGQALPERGAYGGAWFSRAGWPSISGSWRLRTKSAPTRRCARGAGNRKA